MTFGKIFKEPFLHFILIGLTIFLLNGIFSKDESSKSEIIITKDDVARISKLYEQNWNQSPDSETLEKVQNKAIRIITSAPKQFSVTSGRLLLNLHTLHSRRNCLFHIFVKSRVHKGRASKHILHLVSKSNRHTQSLSNNCAIIKPSFRSNLGKSAFLSIFHTFVTKSTKPHETLSFNPT